MDVTGAPALRYLEVQDNRLAALDLANLKLINLRVQNNRILALDVSKTAISSASGLTASPQFLTVRGTTKPGAIVEIDLGQVVGAANTRNITSVSAGTYDPATGILRFPLGTSTFSYTYAAGSTTASSGSQLAHSMTVNASVLV